METRDTAIGGYRRLGLLADPFMVPDDGSANSAGIKLTVQAGAYRLLSAIETAAGDETHKPIVVEKSADIAPFYAIAALARALAALSAGQPVEGIVPAYVPLDMMRVGRVRAVLNVFAERIAGASPDLAIALWSRVALANPDESLPEWTALIESGHDARTVLGEIDSDPEAFSARAFGEKLESRDGAEDFETLMRVSTTRQDRLDADPDGDVVDDATSAEDAVGDPLAEVFTTPLGEIDPSALPEGSETDTSAELLGDYIIAYTHANLSPIIARGIRAYRAQGFASMAEELKISKAPTKTLLALLTFAQPLYRSGVVIYDRLEMWENVPPELRSKIVATLTQLRWALKDHAPLVLLLEPGASPEIEEAFAAAPRIDWRFSELDVVSAEESPFDVEVARSWLASASTSGVAPAWGDDLLSAIPAGTSLEDACRALSRAITTAADLGATRPESTDVVSELSMA